MTDESETTDASRNWLRWVGDVKDWVVAVPPGDRFAAVVVVLVAIIAIVDLVSDRYSLLPESVRTAEPGRFSHSALALGAVALTAVCMMALRLAVTKTGAPGQSAPLERVSSMETNFQPLPSSSDITRAYRGYDPVLKRDVVKKVLVDPGRKQEFIKLVRQVAELGDEANFITIYSANFECDAPYFLMQYAEGGSLRAFIDREIILSGQPLPWADVRRIVSQLGEAVYVAHRRTAKLGHIKPSNILLDAYGEPRISPRTRLTFLNSRKLKTALRHRQLCVEDLAYVAPELLSAGDSDSIQLELCDQYSLGVLAVELLTGALPGSLPTLSVRPPEAAVEQTSQVLLKKGFYAYEEVPPLHSRRLLPSQIGKVLAKMTAIRPQDRFASLPDAMHQLRLAERASLLTARDSYARCLKPGFFEAFYARFTADDGIKARFEDFTAERWTDQRGKLRRAIDACFDFASLPTPSAELPEPNAMSDYVALHGPRRLNVNKREYELFSQALIATVCGDGSRPPFDPECVDPERREAIGDAWRDLLSRITDHFMRVGGRLNSVAALSQAGAESARRGEAAGEYPAAPASSGIDGLREGDEAEATEVA